MAAIAILLYFILAAQAKDPNIEEEELGAFKLLLAINNQTEHIYEKSAYFEWDYASNITDETLQKNLDYAAESAKQTKDIWHQVKQYDWKRFSDYDLKRQFMFYSILGDAALPDSDYKVLKRAVADMESTYATAKICDYHNKTKCDLELEPEMTNILANSRDEKELSHVWLEWRKAVGPKCRETYKTYVDLSNKAARLNNFTDNGDLWLFNYEDPDFKNQIQKLWDQLKPLYLQLHAYVRFKLRQKYGDGVVSEKGPIPAHLLGNMWAQTWGNIASFTLPYPEIEDIDVTSEMVKQGYTVDKIFKTAENFFTSINLTAMPDTFWKNSILIKPNDRELICHASAWDFYNKKDFRIKQCTDINVEDMTTAHHEMGHIEYYLQYKEQPITYRTGANDGFHEAIGDLIALSFSSTKHLRKIGLFKGEDDPKNVLNNLFKIGLDKIAFLPFGYMIDLWRWDVFSGKTTADNYNCKWWELREKFQGIEPPVDRSEEDFDPAGKYHVIADVPYLRYFISYVIQFQFHRALCEKAGEYEPNNPKKPLHECDIYQSTEAGNILKKMLSMGASKPWPDAMEVLTGQRKMDASGLLDYFKPLTDWLEAENQKNDVFIGWEKTKKVCVRTRQELEKPNA